jgi:chromosome segregation ATPase
MEFSKNKGEEFKENFLGTIEGLRRQANDFHTKATDLENKITKISSDASKKDKELDILMHEIEENKKKAEQDLQEALKGANKKNSTLIDQFGSEVHSQVAMLNEAKNNLKEQINSQEQNNQKRVLGLESNLQRLDDLSKGYEEVRKKVSKNSTLVTDKLNNIENQFGTFESGLNKLQNDFTQLGKDREEEGIRKAEKLVKIAIFIEKISNNLALIHERFAQAENKVRVFNEWAAEHEKDLDEIDTLLKDKDVLEIKNNNTKIISFRQNPIETGFYKNGVTNEKFL